MCAFAVLPFVGEVVHSSTREMSGRGRDDSTHAQRHVSGRAQPTVSNSGAAAVLVRSFGKIPGQVAEATNGRSAMPPFILDLMVDGDPLPHGRSVARQGLRGAARRVKDGVSGSARGGGFVPIVIALSEALFWVGALDDEAKASNEQAYWSQRDNDPLGRAVGGLLYARNLHTHALISTAAANWEIGTATGIVTTPGEAPPRRGRSTLFSVQFVWEDFLKLPLPERTEKHSRDRLYAEHVAGRPLSHPLGDAETWFSQLLP